TPPDGLGDAGASPPHRKRRLDGAPHEPGRRRPGEGAEIEPTVGPHGVDHGQPRPPAGGELEVGAALPPPGTPVEPGPVGVVEPELTDRRLERMGAGQVFDGHGLPQPPARKSDRTRLRTSAARPTCTARPSAARNT